MQYILLKELREDNRLWTHIQAWTGISPPTLAQQYTGLRDQLTIQSAKVCKVLINDFEANIKDFKYHIINSIFAGLEDDNEICHDEMLSVYDKRFDTTVNDTTYMENRLERTLSKLNHEGRDPLEIQSFINVFKSNIRNAIDFLTSMLVYFAWPKAVAKNISLLIIKFTDTTANHIDVRLKLFDTTFKIPREYVSFPEQRVRFDNTNRYNAESTLFDADTLMDMYVGDEEPATPIKCSSNAQITNTRIKPTNSVQSKESRVVTNQPRNKNLGSLKQSTPQKGSRTPTRNHNTNTVQNAQPKRKRDPQKLLCKYDHTGCRAINCPFLHKKTPSMACPNKCTRQDCLFDHPLRRILTQDPSSDDDEHVDYRALRRQRHETMDMADYDDEVEEGEHITPAKRPVILKYYTTHSNTTNNNVLTVTNNARQRPRNRFRAQHGTIKDPITLLESFLGSNITNHGVNVLHDCILRKEEHLTLSYGCSFVPLKTN